MKPGGVALAALAALAIGLWLFFAGAADRRLDGLLQTTVDYSEITDVGISPLRKVEDSTNCNGQDARRVAKRAFFTAEQFDYQPSAIASAERFESEGWNTQLSIPDPEGSVTNAWIVEAIREDEYILANYQELGNYSFIARLHPCPTFDEQWSRIIVDDFPAAE